jgi:hypothetical protein
MSEKDDSQTRRRLWIPRVLRLSLEVVKRQWLVLLLLILLFDWAQQVPLGFFPLPRTAWGSHDYGLWELKALRTIGSDLLPWLGSAAVAAVILARTREEKSLLSAIAAGLRAYPTLLPFWLVTAGDDWWNVWFGWMQINHPLSWIEGHFLLLGFAPLALLLAGLLLTAALGLFTPVVVAERRGFVASLRRCWTLMSGSRWPVVALLVMVQGAMIAIDLLYRPVFAILGDPLRQSGLTDAARWFGLAWGLLTSVLGASWWIVVPVCYRELSGASEPADLADVFT